MPESAPLLTPFAWVAKRDGRVEPFEADKIRRALFAASESLGQADAFLARHRDFTLSPIAPGDGGAPAKSVVDGRLRLLPHHLPGGLDGFFVARLVRQP